MTEIEPKVSTTSTDALVDTTPQLSPSSLLRKAEVKAEELARVKQLLMREKRQQLRRTTKENRKNKNRRRQSIAARSRKRNR